MIPVDPQPEPPSFDAKVRAPGRGFLRRIPSPTSKQFRGNRANYWKNCLPELRKAYSQICAYSSCWVYMEGTVDHFWPISKRPDRAYEWDNYRLAFSKLNSYKGSSTDVLDPFHIRDGWFVLDFDNMLVEPSIGLPAHVLKPVQKTISVLRLNDDYLLQLRFTIVREYATRDISFDFLARRYPFIAKELRRQGLKERIRSYFK